MKKLLFILSLSFSSVLFSQERNGITYQALIVDPSGEFLPGADNNYSPLKNTSVCLQFHIIDSTNSYEYSEQHTVTTDNFGMVNLVIGTGSAIGGVGWENVSWSASAKSLKVDVDKTGSCSSFEELSNQPLTSVTFALYSPGSDTPGPQGDPGEEGMSAYEVWLALGNTGTEQDFIDSLKGPEGDPGDPGADGDSAYDLWIAAGNTGTEQEFLDSLKGADGDPGDPGSDGDSAYDIWLSAGNTGTEQEFLDSLKGQKGDPGEDASSNFSGSSFSSSNSDSQTEFYTPYINYASYPDISKSGKYLIYGDQYYDYNSNAIDRGVVEVIEYSGSTISKKITSFGQEFYQQLPGNTVFNYFGSSTKISGDGSTLAISYVEGTSSKTKFLSMDYTSNSWTEIGGFDEFMNRNSYFNDDGTNFILSVADGLREFSISSNQISETSDFSFNTSPQDAYIKAASHDLNTILVTNQNMTGGEFNELTGAGNAFVYEKTSSGWSQKGQVIKGTFEGSSLGEVADMSADGSVVIFSERITNEIDTGSGYTSCFYYSSNIVVYSYDGQNWIQKGSKLTFQGHPKNVQISQQGDFIAVGIDGRVSGGNACQFDDDDKIIFYNYDGNDWNQSGSTLRFTDLKDFKLEGGTLLLIDEINGGGGRPKISFKKLY